MNKQVSNQKMEDVIVEHKTVKVDGLSIFYREFEDHTKPKLVLLHGFPSSSHQYRNLMPAPANHFHVVLVLGTPNVLVRTNLITHSTDSPR
jgi:alpha-beta hydrolase superfamily lysophospholipase